MKYLRFATYILLLAAVVLSGRPRIGVVPVDLATPSYTQQASDLTRSTKAAQTLKAPLAISGGLADGEQWVRSDGPDFYVWTARSSSSHPRVHRGIYLGGYPQVDPPGRCLERGMVAGLPVLWWKHRDELYRTQWDAIVPTVDGEYVHFWISAFDPKDVVAAAELLKNMKLTE